MKINKMCIAVLVMIFPVFFINPVMAGSEEDAAKEFENAAKLEKEGSYRNAAKCYKNAGEWSSDEIMKVNALRGAARSYRNEMQYGAEFDCIEALLQKHLNSVNFSELVDREYEIQNLFFDGHRDYAVYWLPIIPDADRTVELYETALKNAPCAKQSPQQRLRLGWMYLDKDQPEKALEKFEEIVKLHPDTDESRYAVLSICEVSGKLAQHGDGDGSWSRKGLAMLDQFIKERPDDPEIQWVKRTRVILLGTVVKRLHECAVYYHKQGNDEAARSYLVEIVRDYGESEEAVRSENLLQDIDSNYKKPPEGFPRVKLSDYPYTRSQIPTEDSPIIVTPQGSDGRFMFPVRDLKKNVLKDEKKENSERASDNEKI